MNDVQRLKEMGIPVWELRRPQLYPDSSPQMVALPEDCKLLLVCDSPINEKEAWLFGKILASMKLTPEQARLLPSSAVAHVTQHQLQWVWYCGVPAQGGLATAAVLTSPSLNILEHDQSAKKALWQQIKQYDK